MTKIDSQIQSDEKQMFGNNKIYGLDLDQYSADEISEKVGVANLKIEQLLYSVKEGEEETRYAFEQDDFPRYWQSGLRSAPNGYEAYKRLNGKKSPYTTQFVESRALTIRGSPTDIKFWSDPIMIVCLYESLKKDGYYVTSAA